MNEKVRAVRARRNNPALQTNPDDEDQVSVTEMDRGAATAAVRQTEMRARSKTSREIHPYSPEPQKQDSARQELSSHQSNQTRPAQRSSETIVEAALTRVRRASENASRAALPKIEPARPVAQTASLVMDKEATARALEPAPEITRQASLDTLPLAEIAPAARAIPEIAKEPPIVPRMIKPRLPIEPDEYLPTALEGAGESSAIMALDEIEPLDYLEAEIRKVDRVLSAELSKTDSLSLFTHVVINAIDFFIIAISSLPFVALMGLYNGTFSFLQTRVATFGIIALIAFFYLSLTQALCGRTFGMMFTNTRIVDARTTENVTPQRALLRSFGYFLAVTPALLGLVWVAFNRKRRGWHDLISGTQVIGDF
ncbi:MAG TPA: RDD family protein [Blastocatellia bacterium]|nr:RDD family protein [Blastocatellia bacterium]